MIGILIIDLKQEPAKHFSEKDQTVTILDSRATNGLCCIIFFVFNHLKIENYSELIGSTKWAAGQICPVSHSLLIPNLQGETFYPLHVSHASY